VSRVDAPMPPAGREATPAGDNFMRRSGKAFVVALYGALRAVKLYPVENAAVQKALGDVVAAADVVLARDHELTVRAAGEVLFVNDVRLRLEIDSYAAYSHVLTLWRACGVGRLHVARRAEPREWLSLLTALQRPGAEDPEARFEEVCERTQLGGARAFELGPALHEDELPDEQEARSASKRLYSQSVAVAREVLTSLRVGKTPSLRKLKRAVQGIVDQILSEEAPILGLTTLRDFDEYTFTHSVNVGIFSVAIGKRLGLTKLQLYDLGLAAFLHDIGKTRIPSEIINKTSDLTPDEWELVRAHPWLGVLSLFDVSRAGSELPLRAMRVVYEHHLRADASGYPMPLRPRRQGLYSRIVAVADAFDAATSRRSYQPMPIDPAEILKKMREDPRTGHDPVVVKALINTLGIYPIGTLVVLDTFELGIVHGAANGPETISRPVVRIVADTLGNALYPGYLVDLAARGADGRHARTIINTADPERYGIRTSDYFL